jgi:hypothetical protein
MNIQFDTASMNPSEAQALLVFLSTLYGQPSQQPTPAPTTLHEQLKASVEQTSSGPVLVEPTTETTTKRTRRTKEQIAADQAAAAAAPPTVGDQLAAAEAARKAAADAARAEIAVAQPVNDSAKIDADQLRALLNGYIARHSMEDAIEKLRAFGCNRVTEALALESAKLNELAATLNG